VSPTIGIKTLFKIFCLKSFDLFVQGHSVLLMKVNTSSNVFVDNTLAYCKGEGLLTKLKKTEVEFQFESESTWTKTRHSKPSVNARNMKFVTTRKSFQLISIIKFIQTYRTAWNTKQ
jgi:hypothetical protein